MAAGDVVSGKDPLITLESDKATLDIPAPVAGTIAAVRVAVGNNVSAGHVIADLRTPRQPVPGQPQHSPGQPPQQPPPGGNARCAYFPSPCKRLQSPETRSTTTHSKENRLRSISNPTQNADYVRAVGGAFAAWLRTQNVQLWRRSC